MADDVARLNIILAAQNDRYIRKLEQSEKKLDKFRNKTRKNTRQMAAQWKRFGVAVAGVATSGALVSLVKDFANAANHLADMSDRLGIAAEDLSRLHHAAELTGVSTNTLELGLQRMTRRIAEASNGAGEGAKALKALGLNAKELNELDPATQFKVLADALEQVANQGNKVAIAQKLLDSEAIKLLQTMKGGSAAIEEYARQADKLGLTMSGQTAAAGREFNEELIKLKANAQGFANIVLTAVVPSLARFAESIRQVFYTTKEEELQNSLRAVNTEIRLLEMNMGGVTGKLNKFFGMDDTRANQLDKLIAERVRLEDAIAKASSGPTSTPLASTGIDMGAMAGSASSGGKGIGGKGIGDILSKGANAAYGDATSQAERLSQHLKSIEDSLLTEEEAIRQSYSRRQDIVDMALKSEMLSKERYGQISADLERKQGEEIVAVKEGNIDKNLNAMQSAFGTIASLSSSENKKLIAVNRSAAIIQATISAYVGFNKAIEQGGIAGIAIGAGVFATAMANVAAIAGTREKGGPVRGGSTYLVGEAGPELFTAGTSGKITPNNQMGGVNIQLIEDASRAGQQTTTADGIVQIAVASIMGTLQQDLQSGRGLFRQAEMRYGSLRR